MTYPLSVPTKFKVTNSSFRLVRSVGVNESDFTFAQQVYKYQGEKWEGEVSIRAYGYEDIGELQAFILKLKGRYGTFLYGDPDFLARGRRGSFSGTPLVKGASQTGNSLVIDGLTAMGTGLLKAGDYFQLGSGASSQLYMIVDDVNADSTGEATINFEPALRSSHADNAPLTINGAKGVFRLQSNVSEWNSDKSSVYQVSLSFSEVISV